jgi:hypothetical protein
LGIVRLVAESDGQSEFENLVLLENARQVSSGGELAKRFVHPLLIWIKHRNLMGVIWSF